MKDIKVSICCITYNHENYIRDTIEGFLKQKTNFPIEIIIHDDASTDGTPSIIREYESKYPNLIKPIYQSTNKYSKGIKISPTYVWPKAKGEYIAICEGDDYWIDFLKLQKQVEFMDSHPEYSFCTHAVEVIEPDKSKTGNYIKPSTRSRTYTVEEIILGGGGFFQTSSYFFRTSFIKTLPEYYMKSSVGDLPLMLMLASEGMTYYFSETMSAYRTNVPGSWTKRTIDARNREGILKNHENYLFVLDSFDKYTNYKYSDLIAEARKPREIGILITNKNLELLKTGKHKSYYNSLTLVGKMKLYGIIYFRGLYIELSKIKKVVRHFAYRVKSILSKGI